MITRRQFRGWLKWTGVGVGIAGIAVYLFSLVGVVGHDGPHRSFAIGHGAILISWSEYALQVRARAASGTGARYNPVEPEWKWESPRGRPWRWIPRWQGDQSVDPRLVIAIGSASVPGQAVVPAWLLILVGIISVYLMLPSDVPAGMCPKCRFDLSRAPPVNGKPGHVKCPECGCTSLQPTAASPRSPDSSHQIPAPPPGAPLNGARLPQPGAPSEVD